MITRSTICSLACLSTLLIAAPALANWRNYNTNYGKGASFSKGTMIRNGSGASIRYSAGSTAVSTPKRVVTPRRSFAVVKHQNLNYRLHRHGKPAGRRSVSVDNILNVTGKETIRFPGKNVSRGEARRLVRHLGGKPGRAKVVDGRVVSIKFKAEDGSLLNRLGDMVYRVNKAGRQSRARVPASKNANRGTGKASGNPLYTSPTSNPEHAARANQPGYKDGNVTTRAGYLRNHGTSGRWSHGRYRTR